MPDAPGSRPPAEYRGRLGLRYLLFLLGLFFIALGVAVMVRALLGTSPIATPAYVSSLPGWWSFGVANQILNVLFVLIQILLLRRQFPPIQLIQIPIALTFGFLIDGSMWLTTWLQPQAYWAQWLAVLVGSALIALGVSLENVPKVLMAPGDALVATLARQTGVLIGNMKVMFDVTLVGLGALLSLVLFHEIVGIREGTVASMFLVGFIVGRILPPMDRAFARYMLRG